MYLLSLAAATASGSSLPVISQGLLYTGMGLVVLMTLAYLSYTLGSVRLAKKVALARAASRKARAKAEKSARAASESGGGVATLVRPEVILNEQPDGEEPIALNRTLLTLGRGGMMLGWLAVLALVVGLVTRTLLEQHAPWSNLYEFSVSFTTAFLICYLIFELRFHERVRAWGFYVCLLAVIILSVAVYLGIAYNMLAPNQELIPALQDRTILAIHVGVAIFAYSLFCVAFGAGLVMLIQGGEGQRYRWLPSAEAADALGYKAVIAGFPLLALTLIIGAYWANYAWGHYWSWDPKETSALVTWLIYAVYLHARGIRGWRGKRIAWLLALGFVATLFTYYGVSFFVPSLHSYATPQ
ncbi:MAG TPA: c-type cytochrome biogenesis protein CcsB [Ktedonobacteraceae bacterium]|jgi:cytochrome c-type biogenesis protein CcsB|nr:c-type cytochrome biogenesis protein CcsB [Ktedonobacteraceae bacterium]